MKRKSSLLQDPHLDKIQLAFAKQALRRASYRWPARNQAVKEARIERGVYECKECKTRVPNRDKELDHVEPVVRTSGQTQTLGEFASRLFCGLEGFQVLCNNCHSRKSFIENVVRRTRRKLLLPKSLKDASKSTARRSGG